MYWTAQDTVEPEVMYGLNLENIVAPAGCLVLSFPHSHRIGIKEYWECFDHDQKIDQTATHLDAEKSGISKLIGKKFMGVMKSERRVYLFFDGGYKINVNLWPDDNFSKTNRTPDAHDDWWLWFFLWQQLS